MRLPAHIPELFAALKVVRKIEEAIAGSKPNRCSVELQSTAMSTVTEAEPARTEEQSLRRQFVNFMFFKADRALRSESSEFKAQAKREFAEIVERYNEPMMVLPYSTLGLKSTVDFMLWRISFEIEPLQQMAAAINKSVIGRYLDVPQSYLAMTKHSQYVQEHVHDGQEGRRTRIVPGKKPFLFVYPFVKTRDWYLLPQPERQRIMNEHIAVGHKYPRVKINTTYSFGLDDQDFVVAFEAESPAEFLDLVQDLRETESSKYTVRDTPMYTCKRATIDEILDSLA
jgi:chlorite dismutase